MDTQQETWFDKAKRWGIWLLKHWWVILIAVIAIEYKQLYDLKIKYQKALGEKSDVARQLQLKENELAKIRLQGGRVIYLTRTVAGGQATSGIAPFVPPEGGGTVTVAIDPKTGLPYVTVDAQTKGFTLKPGLGVLYSGKLCPELDLKFAYWGRYSLKIGATPDFVDCGVTRHVDDLVPWFDLRNLEIQVVGGVNYTSGKRIGIGIRSNL